MDFDVVVIGASSAGLFAAEILAKSGKKVALFEKTDLVSPESRLYIITPGIYRVIPDIDPSLIRHKIHRIKLQSGLRETDVILSTPDLILDRKEILLALKNRADKAGVRIFTGSEFKGFESESGRSSLRILSDNKDFLVRTRYLIGADGVASKVRRESRLDAIQTVPLLQAEVNLPDDWDEKTTKVWFDVKNTPYFYWLIPDKRRRAVVGLIAEPGIDIKNLLDRFLGNLGLAGISFQSGLAALHAPGIRNQTQVGDIRVYFAGDAGGQVKVTTVGGTVTGFYGGRAAAEAILKGRTYQSELRPVQRELNLHAFIRNLLEKMSADEYQNMIQSINHPVQNLLSSHDRDGMRAHFWKLPFLQPKFIPLGIKLLLK